MNAGFTIVEVAIATAIFAVLGYVLMASTEMGLNSQEAVSTMVERGKAMRSSRSSIGSELKTTSDDTMTVTTLADGNHELSFMVPITQGGTNTWGVYDPSWGPDEDDQNRENWQIRYTVGSWTVNGTPTRSLIRQVIDEAGDVQEKELVASGLKKGTTQPPGFSVLAAGDMWEIQINKENHAGEASGEGVSFYVRTRN